MLKPLLIAATVVAAGLSGGPAVAIDGEILLTHAKALAGNVTPGDTAGYPITLSLPGTYKVASNLFVAAQKIGIQVTSANVTVDLNGFALQGSNVAWHGVTGGLPSITIRNGTIAAFKYDGIIGTGESWIVENMRVTGNGRVGVSMYPYARIVNNTVTRNGTVGIQCSSCHVADNIVSLNGGSGIWALVATVLGNSVFDNTGYGILGNGATGFGDNTVAGNNGGNTNPQVFNVSPLHPNVCIPAC
jgi:hypothetical protein